MPEERRVVTVLFADVSGFTAMSESLDPEDVRTVMNDCFGALSEEIYRQGGVVDKYVGDNVMALFGVPKAQEDDAARAVRAALAMQERLAEISRRLERERGFGLRMRVGLNTGLVVAGDVGSREKSTFTVMGDAVNLASRIEHHARPGEVWVSQATALAAGEDFSFERQPPIAVKGKSRPQVFLKVDGLRRAGAEISPFAGRVEELAVLHRALGEALAGQTRVITISGEAGVGKTRLTREFLADAEAEIAASGCRLLTARAFPREQRLYSLFEPLATELGFELPGGAVETGGRALTPPSGDPSAAGDASKSDCFCSVEKAIRERATRTPLILSLEDAHFADSGSWELLSCLLSALKGLPILWLILFRPEAEKALLWSGIEGHRPLRLGPLKESERLNLVDRLLGPNKIPRDVKEEFSRYSGGNGFFLTQLVRHFMECDALVHGGSGWQLRKGYRLRTPEGVSGVVLARMDRLPPRERLSLEVASCAGLEFEKPLLALAEPSLQPCGPALRGLCERRFLDERGGALYSFTHAILQDVSYESVLKERRRAYHRRIAAFWEARDEAPEGLRLTHAADHYYWCREPSKALELNWKAGLRAAACYAAEQSLLFLRRCQELLELQPPGPGLPARPELMVKLGDLYSWISEADLALECYREAISSLSTDDPLLVAAHRKAAVVYNIQGEPRQAEETLCQAAKAMAARGENPRALALYYELATAYFRSGQNERAREWLGRILESYKSSGRAIPIPPDADIYRLMPAFSDLVGS